MPRAAVLAMQLRSLGWQPSTPSLLLDDNALVTALRSLAAPS